MARVAGVLLAAGGGRRLGGRVKALLPYRGRPLVELVVGELRAAGCAPVVVVLGAGVDEVLARAALDDCLVVRNPAWESGMGSSLRAGLAALGGLAEPPAGALVALVDQPFVGTAAMARVAGALRSPETLAAAAYRGERGHPVLLGAAHLAGVAEAARGDRGARDYLRARADRLTLVECADVADPGDLDHPADLRRLSEPPTAH
ncbi:nucleotidyltransferase family protein [Streptomyces sp. DSM 44915]|uniref:Nucleotidyltransferase family protein n=1 Tax=Streptomyces chisholmiae TaxID=3075540 RepID=A0ABU2JMY1_9ACTN|nr:nucleotidyltransferase family protein [Streptomyces sp. DSM 44915]MDT0266350.1 nucleotidyltransferase family protein [Streptomyces sp. DSM 44915]